MESKTDIGTVAQSSEFQLFIFNLFCITNCLIVAKQYSCYLIVLMDQASGHGKLCCPLQISHKAVVMVLARDGVSSEAMTGEKMLLSCVDVGEIYFLGDWWTQGLNSYWLLTKRHHCSLAMWSLFI